MKIKALGNHHGKGAPKLGVKTRLRSSQDGERTAEAFDIVIMADLAGAGDIGLRIAAEVETLWTAGYRIGLMHVSSNLGNGRISPPVRRSVQSSKAIALDPLIHIRASLLVIHIGNGKADFAAHLRTLVADRAVAVVDRAPDFELARTALVFASIGLVTWAPTNRWVRATLEAAQPSVAVEAEDWIPVVAVLPNLDRPELHDTPVTVARIAGAGSNQWPGNWERLKQELPTDGSVNVILLGRPAFHLLPRELPRSWRIFGHDEVAVEWMLREADIIAYFPGAEATELPDAAIVAAAAAGKAVVLPPRLKAHFGDCATYCDAAHSQGEISKLAADSKSRSQLRAATMAAATRQFSAKLFLDRVAKLTGRRAKLRSAIDRIATISSPDNVLFLASNGIGLGHVARLLAIARRSEARFQPVFATMAPATRIIENFGYLAEYIPSQMYIGAAPLPWDDWLGFEIERLIDCYSARGVVYDGNDLPAGLLRVVMAKGNVKLAWIRRSMGEKDLLPTIANARFCDIIIEPGEVAREPHFYEMSRMRRGIVTVEPIRLLDDTEPLLREEAAAALNLDPAKPAVLIHLGAGANRDITHIVDVIMRELQRFPDIQIAIAEWANAEASLSLWPEAVVVRGFPLSRYFNAFNFSVGAAGYNSFHEVISLALPTIFVANTAPGMDDQIGRARFAQDAGAAFELSEDRLFELPEICKVLLNDKACAVIRDNCRKINRSNGAIEAAKLVGELL